MQPGRLKVTVAACVAALIALSLVSHAYAEKKPRIAVLPFDSSRIATGYARLSTDVVNGMFETELVKTGKFTVIERKRLEEVLSEQGLGLSGAIDPTTAVQVGRILGVELILVGDITKLGVRKSGGGAGGLFGGSKSTLEGGLDVRLVSTKTAQIVFAEMAEGEDATFKVRVLGIGGGVDIDETKMDKVFRPCVRELVGKMAENVDGIIEGLQGGVDLTAKIANVIGGKIYLNKGSRDGVNVGDVFEVYRPGQEIRDPDTGAVLDVEETLIGKIIVTEVKEKVAVASSQSGTGFESGDVVRPPDS